MSRNWIRTCALALSGSSERVVSGGGPTDLRIRFEITSHTLQELGQAQIIITNPSKQLRAQMQGEFKKLSLTGGYQGNTGLLFSGEIVETQDGEREGNTDRLLRIWARDSDGAYNQALVNKTLAAGSTPQQVVDTALDAFKPFGVTMGQVVDVDLTQPKFPRGYPLAGMARDAMREVATSKQATWNLNGGKLNIIAKGAKTPGDAIKLNGATGMVGWPIVRPDGVIVTCLINPAIHVDSMIEVASSSIVQTKVTNAGVDTSGRDAQLADQLAGLGAEDGVYRVLHINVNGDTRGGPWLMELTCLGAFTGVGNTVQAGLGYA